MSFGALKRMTDNTFPESSPVIADVTFGRQTFSFFETCKTIQMDMIPSHLKTEKIPLYGLFEIQIQNKSEYIIPFTEVELNTVFTSPQGRKIILFCIF